MLLAVKQDWSPDTRTVYRGGRYYPRAIADRRRIGRSRAFCLCFFNLVTEHKEIHNSWKWDSILIKGTSLLHLLWNRQCWPQTTRPNGLRIPTYKAWEFMYHWYLHYIPFCPTWKVSGSAVISIMIFLAKMKTEKGESPKSGLQSGWM